MNTTLKDECCIGCFYLNFEFNPFGIDFSSVEVRND